LGKRFNEELMYARRIPKRTAKDAMKQWREKNGLMDSQKEFPQEGSVSADTTDGGSNDSPTQDGEEPTGGSDRLAVRKKRNPKRRKTKTKRAS
jgi:hypothetical protein